MTPAAMKFNCWPLYNCLRRGFPISWCGKFAHSLCTLVPQSGAPDWSRDQAQVCLISKQLHTDNYTKDGMMYNRIQESFWANAG